MSEALSDLFSIAEQEGKFYGKYRGIVVQNIDPEFRGRIQVQVPGIVALPSTWAEPCLPLAGIQMGIFIVPPVGAGVWVEFEQGNPDYPIWTGCFWGSQSSVPSLALAGIPADPNIVIQSQLQHSLVISDMPPTPATGGIILKSATGAMIVVNDTGIYISNGKGASITMVGPTVTINNGALVVI